MQPHRLSVAFVLSPQFTLLAFSSFVDTLRLAADDGDRSRPIQCAWSVLSHTMRPIRSSSGIEVLPTVDMVDPTRFDYVVVVGGVLENAVLPTVQADYLCRAAASGVPLVGICTGSFTLAALGLMEDRRCCVSWFHIAEFQSRFPALDASSESLYIVDEDRLTCAGGTSVVHLASHLVEKHCGKRHADKALRIMIEETKVPSASVQPQPYSANKTDDDRVQRAMLLMERNLESPVSLEFVASHVGLSVRQLERLFKAEIGMTPSQFTLQMRLTHALHLLETTRDPIFDIALRCGFVNHSHFAHYFRTRFGQSPTQMRAQHRAASCYSARSLQAN